MADSAVVGPTVTVTVGAQSASKAPLGVYGPVFSVIIVVLANLVTYLCNQNSILGRRTPARLPPRFQFASNTLAASALERADDGVETGVQSGCVSAAAQEEGAAEGAETTTAPASSAGAQCVSKRQQQPELDATAQPQPQRACQPREFWAFELLDPSHPVTSPLGPRLSWLPLLLHLVTLAYFVVTVAVERTVEPSRTVSRSSLWLTYYTNWSLVALALGATLGAANTLRYMVWKGNLRKLQSPSHHHQQSPRQSLESCCPFVGEPASGSGSGSGGSRADRRTKLPSWLVRVVALDFGRKRTGATLQLSPRQYAGRGGSASGGATGGDSAETGDVVPAIPASSGAGADEGAKEDANVRQVQRRYKWSAVGVAHVLTIEVAATAAVSLTLYYWVAMVALDSTEGTALELRQASTYLKHGANTLFALLHVLTYRLPIVSQHYWATLLYTSCYVLLLLIYGSTTGEWRYSINWAAPRGLVSFALMPFGLLLCFGVLFWAARVRELLVARRMWRTSSPKAERR